MMKRLILKAVLVLTIMGVPMTCKAQGQDVIISSADSTSTGTTVSGTTNAPAVMVQIRDENNYIVTMASFPVVNGEFSANISQSLTAGSEYTIYVADYEGGAFTTETVTATAVTTPTTPSNPTTSNATDTPGSSDTSETAVTPVQPVVPDPVVPPSPDPAPVTPTSPVKPEASEKTDEIVSSEKPVVTTLEKEENTVADLSEEPVEDEENVVDNTVEDPTDQKDNEKESGKGFIIPLVIVAVLIFCGGVIFLIIKKKRDDEYGY